MASKEESTKLQETTAHEEPGSPKKRRKVNHACIYCRRSHMTCDLNRPCARCIKRSIGHLCHDEPREPSRRSKREVITSNENNEAAVKGQKSLPHVPDLLSDQRPASPQFLRETEDSLENSMDVSGPSVDTTALSQNTAVSAPVPGIRDKQPYSMFPEWNTTSLGQFQDMQNIDASYLFNAPDITNEYNLLNEFLSTSLIDDPNVFPNDDLQMLNADTSIGNTLAVSSHGSTDQTQSALHQAQQADASLNTPVPEGNIGRPASTRPTDKEDDRYYMTIADPSGNEKPEERMNKVFMTKFNAGMLRPFNYIQGYARLQRYMDQNMQQASRQRILRQLDKFRPKFRERMQSLTDMELTLVEMWFERSLMEYDRVFASMAIPACCWRRTGEIFRGNKEMAELIHVPIEHLRDGKLALHEIIMEQDLVNYWDKFLSIAFDNSQKAMLTSCSLKNPDNRAVDPDIRCCFSFTIRRDYHNIPSLIVGNFLPQIPR